MGEGERSGLKLGWSFSLLGGCYLCALFPFQNIMINMLRNVPNFFQSLAVHACCCLSPSSPPSLSFPHPVPTHELLEFDSSACLLKRFA